LTLLDLVSFDDMRLVDLGAGFGIDFAVSNAVAISRLIW
jgi:hypothetical protein